MHIQGIRSSQPSLQTIYPVNVSLSQLQCLAVLQCNAPQENRHCGSDADTHMQFVNVQPACLACHCCLLQLNEAYVYLPTTGVHQLSCTVIAQQVSYRPDACRNEHPQPTLYLRLSRQDGVQELDWYDKPSSGCCVTALPTPKLVLCMPC